MIASSAAPTAAALLASARVRLVGAPREPLGDWASSRRLLGFGRAPRIVHVGDVWHLGILLLGDSAVYATGEVLRAREDVVRGFTAQSQRERAERAAAAFRGGFPDGATVHVGWTELDVAAVDAGGRSGPLDGANGILTVRWSAAAAPRALADYLDDLLTLAGR